MALHHVLILTALCTVQILSHFIHLNFGLGRGMRHEAISQIYAGLGQLNIVFCLKWWLHQQCKQSCFWLLWTQVLLFFPLWSDSILGQVQRWSVVSAASLLNVEEVAMNAWASPSLIAYSCFFFVVVVLGGGGGGVTKKLLKSFILCICQH